MPVFNNITQLIGKTPLMELNNFTASCKINARILGKLELFNPAGSVKDRIALEMLLSAEEKGLINKDTVIIEPTSGNTGIGLAAISAARGYRLILTMPETMSTERRKLLAAYGAELVLTQGSSISNSVAKANELASELPNSFIPSQFDNPANPTAHRKTTGPEIWNDTEGQLDFFVAGIGTGGTITGVGEYLKSKKLGIKIVGFEPFDSPLITQGRTGSHRIQGIGADFIPSALNINILDEVLTVTTEDAFATCRRLATSEGILVGITSGAAVWVAAQLATRPENQDKTIVALLPDTGDRYLSAEIFN